MRGGHVRRNEPAHGRHEPVPDHGYGLLIDVAGEKEVKGTALDRFAWAKQQESAWLEKQPVSERLLRWSVAGRSPSP